MSGQWRAAALFILAAIIIPGLLGWVDLARVPGILASIPSVLTTQWPLLLGGLGVITCIVGPGTVLRRFLGQHVIPGMSRSGKRKRIPRGGPR